MVFPLVFFDFYYDIADAKYLFFTIATLITSFLLLVCILISVVKRETHEEIKIHTAAKWCVVWCMVNVISYLISEYKTIALAGTDGRNFGLVTVLCITILFFVVQFSDISFNLICGMFTLTACLVSCLGVINSYGFDPIGFYEGVRPDLKMFYQTTIGHIDICATYYAIAFPIAAFSFIKSKELKRRVIYGMASLVIFAGMFACGCDSGYINLGVTIVFLLIFANNIAEINLTGTLVIAVMSLAKIMMYVNLKVPSAKEMDSIAIIFTDNRVFLTVIILVSAYLAICNITGKLMKKYLYVTAISVLAAVICIAVYFSVFDINKDIGSVSNLIRWNDKWGSYRGYIWRISLENYCNLPIVNKLFGTGPDTLEPVLMVNYEKEMYSMFSAYYDNSHNELIQYLCVTGIFGLITYAGIVVAVFISGVKRCRENESALPIYMGIVCYFIQSFVGINQIMTTPLYFLCMAFISTEKNKK